METSCNARSCQEATETRPGMKTYVTAKVLLLAKEGVVPLQLGLEETLELLGERRVGLEAENPANPATTTSALSSPA